MAWVLNDPLAMPYYQDPYLVTLVGLVLTLGLAILVVGKPQGRQCPASPSSFEVMGADGVLHTIKRHPARDPLPDPETAPGETPTSPGTSSHSRERNLP